MADQELRAIARQPPRPRQQRKVCANEQQKWLPNCPKTFQYYTNWLTNRLPINYVQCKTSFRTNIITAGRAQVKPWRDHVGMSKQDAEIAKPCHLLPSVRLKDSQLERVKRKNEKKNFIILITFALFHYLITLACRQHDLTYVACERPFRATGDSLADFLAQQGGVINSGTNLTLTKLLNPIIIKRDVIVKRNSKLTIGAGSELLFDKRKGIIVHGTLEILGQPNEKVKLSLLKNLPTTAHSTSSMSLSQQQQQAATSVVNFRSHHVTNSNNQFIHQLNSYHQSVREQKFVRLVDGDLPNEGRAQIRLNERWHSLCTNSKNLTAADIKILCRHVGYKEGHWFRWFPRRNESSSIFAPEAMCKSFHCVGNESSLTQCKRWNRLRTGGGICDNQSNIGIRCSRELFFNGDGPEIDESALSSMAVGRTQQHFKTSGSSDYNQLHSLGAPYWRGLEFVNSESRQEYVLDGQMKQKVSKSRLNHLMISEAGLEESGNATAALRIYGQPPRLNDLEIKNSVYGIMIEDLDDAVKLSNIKLTNNLARPLFVNTSWGKVTLDRLQVENNGGDGVRVVRHERIIVGSHDFCKFANLGTAQSYPVILSHEQRFLTSGMDCCQEFISQNQLTVRFPVLRSTPNNLFQEGDSQRLVSVPANVQVGRDANLLIYDDYRDEYPFKVTIRNETRAQSIVSKAGRLKICYEPASYRTVLFTIEVVADTISDTSATDYYYGTGIAHDVEISNSFIKRNEGRGIWLDNPRSGVLITNTTVIEHNYLSGVHVENGTGEVIIQASFISNNTGHGVYIHLAGGYYHIDNSTISDNTQKGISIDYDKRLELAPFNHTMHLGYSLVANNGAGGISIGSVCRADAFWNISMNSFIRNGEDAIVFQSCFPTSDIVLNFNRMTSRLNSSGSDLAKTNEQLSYGNNLHQLMRQTKLQELFITHNVFLENQRRAIKMAPVFFVKSFIRHNLFKDHPIAVLYINNQAFDGELLNNSTSSAPVNVRIASNRFYTNRGRYVANLGLQEDSLRQSLMFTKNYLEDNAISEPYADLRPRSRVSAVVVISSSNSKVVRNRFDNPRSSFEMGAHLEAHSKIINATANFWGFGLDASAIYKRIFDRKNRYNLAQIEFLQYLLSPEDLEYITDLSFDRERDKISTFKNGTRLGGEVKGYEELLADTYIVSDDIFVRPGGHLVLRPGSILKFHDGVGMMVQGRLDALGQANSQINFTSALAPGRLPQRAQFTTTSTTAGPPFASAWVSHSNFEEANSMNSTNNNKSARGAGINNRNWLRRYKRQAVASAVPGSGSNVRLSHTTMGRLEVQIDGVWGSVCDYNFDISDAAVACQQLGMIVNKNDWLLERFQYMAVNDQQQFYDSLSSDSLMTNVQCDPTLDTDITACKAEISLRGDFDGMCNSEVGIRCFPPSWSGVRLGMGAETSTLENVIIQRAGMFDYATYSLKPALQIDFNRHWLNSLVIRANSDSGLGIMFNDVIGRHFSELSIIDSKFLNNERHGIELRSRGMTIKGCTLANNRQNGLDYNPTFGQNELDNLLSWLETPKNSDNIVTLNFPLQSANSAAFENGARTNTFLVPSSEDAYRFFVIPRDPRPNLNETFTICTDPGHMLSIHLISPINSLSSEMLNMSLGSNPETQIWDLRVNSTSFPMISPGYKFHFNYTSGSQPLGNIVLYVRSRYNNRDLKVLTKFIPHHLIMPKFDQTATNINSKLINSLVISNNTFIRNGIGLKFRHFNYGHGILGGHKRRYSNETTNITSNVFEANYFSSIFVGSDDHYDPTLGFSGSGNNLDTISLPGNDNKFEAASSEIRYNLLNNKMRRNRDGVRQFNRDIRYSDNVFHWTIDSNIFEQNKGGGINIQLPYFWRYDTNLSHTVQINNNSFLKNVNFELGVDGHFAKLNLTQNKVYENRCRNRLIGFSGMEKQFLFKDNLIEHNVCNRIVDFNIQSHADKMGSLSSQFEHNTLRSNRRLISNLTFTSLASNFRFPKLLDRLHPQATDHALGLRGIQSLNITRNIFSNSELRFELVVAIVMEPDERTVSATENYWGSSLPMKIEERIFDFNDWNNYAMAEFSPFLTSESLQAATMLAENDLFVAASESFNQATLLRRSLGGRLLQSLVLPYRKEPYLVESDLTVMPNVRLTIERGVTLEFMPNVGILVLGELIAAGTRERPIQMRPLLSALDVLPLSGYLFPTKTRPNITQAGLSDPLSYEHNYAFKHYQFTYPLDMGSIRLCKNEICNDGKHIYDNNVEDPVLRKEVLDSYEQKGKFSLDGFLEIFNMTILQWVPVCDPLFTEHTARVVCRELGYSQLSLFKRGRRYTIEQEQITSVKNWPPSIQCEGDEANLSSCQLAATLTATNNSATACLREGNQFVYVYCRDFVAGGTADGRSRDSSSAQQQQQKELLSSQAYANSALSNHWGGIRFSCSSYNKQLLSAAGHDDDASRQMVTYPLLGQASALSHKSRLQYVSIDKAGLLHRQRAPAIHVLQCNVNMEHVSISNAAHHGLEMITSQANQHFHQLKIKNNLGLGVNYLSLTGSSSASRLIPYLPLKQLDLSSDIFGLVDVCGANKEIKIDERLLLFFRYSSQPVDCVKIISSKLSVKHLGIRMLQFNLFNSTQHAHRADNLRIYDGNMFDRDSRLLVELGVEERHRNERPELKFYQTIDSTMTVRLHASGAGPFNGFIAEVVTAPVAYNIQRDSYNNMTFAEISGNKLGAMSIYSAGESTPNMIFKNNRFESNCLHLFGNFTSCLAPVYMELQNCQRLKVLNNLFKGNQAGGLMIKSYSHSAVAALEAFIERNVFEENQIANALALLGPKGDPYQKIHVLSNFFTRNFARYLSNVVLSRVVSNFSLNIMSSNVGKHQIEVLGFDKQPISHQEFFNNWIYNNTATFERDQSTISGNSAGQQYHHNYVVNPDNHFELSTRNWSRYEARPFQVARDDELIHLVSPDGSSKDMLRKNVDSIPLNVIEAKRLGLYQASIDARQNWWGFNTSAAIQNRIRDRVQHEELIRVDFSPFLETNRSILSGACSGGWQRVNGACLVYVSTRMTYAEARDFCDRERATLPLLRGNHYEFTDFVKIQEAGVGGFGAGGFASVANPLGSGNNNNNNFDAHLERIWVRSFDVAREACPALNDYRTRNFDCNDRYAFLCEKDPHVVVTLLHWHRERGGIVALLLALITIVLACCCSCCWMYKSRERHKEKLERKNSLYASMRSVRNAAAYSSSNSLSEFYLHRQLYNTEKSSITDLSMSTQWTQPSSNDETNLVRLDPNGGGGRGSSASVQSTKQQQQQQSGFHRDQDNYQRRPAYVQNERLQHQQQQQHQRVQPLSISNGGSLNQVNKSQAITYNPNYAHSKSYRDLTDSTPTLRKTPTPLPSVSSYKRESAQGAPLMGSRTPSFAGSYTNEPPSQPPFTKGQVTNQTNGNYSISSRQLRAPRPAQEDYSLHQPSPPLPQPHNNYQATFVGGAPQQPRAGSLLTSRSMTTPTPEHYDFHPPSVEPPPALSYQYSNIRFNPDASTADSGPQTPLRRAWRVTASDGTPTLAKNQANAFARTSSGAALQSGPADDSNSSARTYASSQNSEEYLEAYNLYRGALDQNPFQQQLNDDRVSVVITERSSITDSIVNTRITESQIDYVEIRPTPLQPQATQMAPYGGLSWREDAADMVVRGQSDGGGGSVAESIYQNGHILADHHQQQHYNQRAASDLSPLAQNNARLHNRSASNLVETSLDLDSPTPTLPSSHVFGGSQRLSSGLSPTSAPVPSAFPTAGLGLGNGQDSKSGSRNTVYLETSFE